MSELSKAVGEGRGHQGLGAACAKHSRQFTQQFLQLGFVKYLLYANPMLGTGESSREQQKQTPPLSSNSPGRETDGNQRIVQTMRNDRWVTTMLGE